MMLRTASNPFALALFCWAGILTMVGCGGDATSTDNDRGAGATADLPAGLFVDAAPEGASSITALKASAAEGDEVVVRVIVGGRINPIVDGRASATIIDADLPNKCVSEDDHCTTPWDYCCTPKDQITANLATLQVVDADGRVLAADLGPRIKPLSMLTVRGVVGPRPDAGVLTINATDIHVSPDTP